MRSGSRRVFLVIRSEAEGPAVLSISDKYTLLNQGSDIRDDSGAQH